MSILDDLAMGFGLKKPDQDYIDRTAKTISKTQGQAAADKYLANQSISSNQGVSFVDEQTGETGRTLRPKARPTYAVPDFDDDGNKTGSFSPATLGSGTAGMYNTYTGNPDSPVSLTEPTAMESMGQSIFGGTLGLLGGARSQDSVVNVVDGKPIYRDSKGRTYAFNSIGIPYNTKDENTLEEDPARAQDRADMMQRMDDRDDEPSILDDLLEEKDPMDPCPDGYVYDDQQKMCVIDPSSGLTTEVPTMELPDPSVPLSPYTQLSNNFIPTPLQPTAPNPIQQQLTQMNQAMRRPQQPMRPLGLAGANTGIMQVKP